MQWLDEDFAEACDFELIGIRSHVGPHRLAWELNRKLDWHLAYYGTIQADIQGRKCKHVVHRYTEATSGMDVAMVVNRTPDGTLAEGAMALDYLIRLAEGPTTVKELLPLFREMNLVTLAVLVDPVRSGALEELGILELIDEE